MVLRLQMRLCTYSVYLLCRLCPFTRASASLNSQSIPKAQRTRRPVSGRTGQARPDRACLVGCIPY